MYTAYFSRLREVDPDRFTEFNRLLEVLTEHKAGVAFESWVTALQESLSPLKDPLEVIMPAIQRIPNHAVRQSCYAAYETIKLFGVVPFEDIHPDEWRRCTFKLLRELTPYKDVAEVDVGLKEVEAMRAEIDRLTEVG